MFLCLTCRRRSRVQLVERDETDSLLIMWSAMINVCRWRLLSQFYNRCFLSLHVVVSHTNHWSYFRRISFVFISTLAASWSYPRMGNWDFTVILSFKDYAVKKLCWWFLLYKVFRYISGSLNFIISASAFVYFQG